MPKITGTCVVIALASSLLAQPFIPSESTAFAGTEAPGKSGEPGQETLAQLELRLEGNPDDPTLLESTGLAALKAGETDRGLWYLSLALEQASSDDELAERIRTAFSAVERPGANVEELLTDYAETLFKLGKSCASKKLYANAVDLFGRCRGTSFEEDAMERLEKLYGNEKAVAGLLATGLDVPVQGRAKLKPREVARMDAKHETWEDAYEIKGKFYTVRTNMGYVMAHDIANAMEQMNASYRHVFGYKERGGSMRRCVINVYATRAGFDELGDRSPNVKGFFRPGENSVTTYDPRTEPQGRDISFLWSTLFHEASHQFTDAVWPNPIPTWLNEGTASYFEGARLQTNGKVAFNGIPDGRLRGVVARINQGAPKLEEVITYFQDGSYPGEYYPFGWGLVYFLHNFEDEDSERVYLPIYRDFMQSYKSGGKHDIKARFEEFFVKKAKVPGIDSFEDFVSQWETWLKELHGIHFGGADQADTLTARAARQLENEKPEQAIESYRWALVKRPSDTLALGALAAILADVGQDDGAIYTYRQLATLARAVVDPAEAMPGDQDRTASEVLALALSGIAGVNEPLAEDLGSADAALVTASLEAAGALVDAGLPRSALLLLNASNSAMGGDGRLGDLAAELGQELDLRRWRRLDLSNNLENWTHDEDWSSSDAEVQVQTDSITFAIYAEELPDSYVFTSKIHAGDLSSNPVLGLSFARSARAFGQHFVVVPATGLVGLIELKNGALEMTETFQANLDPDATALTLSIEMEPGHARFLIDGAQVGEIFGGDELLGPVGLIAQHADTTFEGIRIRY
ncbi:MAG: hypothetical protein ACI8QS_000686 [Planctomycetota bacterium]|jgi:hypothetical protein